ncbi:TNF receptor-associated factor 4-like [Dysidea avara]|uniref:TNF receptor-associated factor 4-like n=1 Tax=Dysidea avara TaxID=196820 RepID=UPI00333382D4
MATPTQDPGGYDECRLVVNPPHDRYVCKMCHRLCKEPYLSVCCGHNCCKSCVAEFLEPAIVLLPCPMCGDTVAVVPNKQADREIKSFQAICTNKEIGCEWQGELSDITDHLGNSDGCQFEEVDCTLECGVMIQRRYLTNHVENKCPRRIVDCQHCCITGEYDVIEGEHKEQCSKLPLPCPNNCEAGSILREDMEAHRKECPLEMVQCEYHNVGCVERMMRKRKRITMMKTQRNI